MNQTPPMAHTPGAAWVLVAVSGLLVLSSLIRRRRKPPAPKYHVVSWRVLYWRSVATKAEVRRKVAPLETQVHELARLTELFPNDPDQEGDHAALC